MTLSINQTAIIPYGSANIRSEVLGALTEENLVDLEKPGAPVAMIDTNHAAPLRLHSVQHPFTRLPVAQDLAHADTQLAFLENHLTRLCGERAKPAQAFIAAYFQELRCHVRDREADLAHISGPLSGLIDLDHWCFSGLMPLPSAFLYCPENEIERRYVADDFVKVDAAFWTGTQVAAVMIDSGNTLIGKRRQAIERLQQQIMLQWLPVKLLVEPIAAGDLLAKLGPAFEGFLAGQDLPASPFRGRGIPAPQPAIRSS